MADEFMKDIEKAVEQNDNMLDGIINNGANDREIPGTFDAEERESEWEQLRSILLEEHDVDEHFRFGKLDMYDKLTIEVHEGLLTMDVPMLEEESRALSPIGDANTWFNVGYSEKEGITGTLRGEGFSEEVDVVLSEKEKQLLKEYVEGVIPELGLALNLDELLKLDIHQGNTYDIEKAMALIDEYSQREFGDNADFTDLANVGLAYTTISFGDSFSEDDIKAEFGIEDPKREFDLQVSADLLDLSVSFFVDGDEISKSTFTDLEDMNNFFSFMEFDSLVSLDMDEWKIVADRLINEEAAKAIDEHEAEFGADGARVFPHLNDEPVERSTIYFYPEMSNEAYKELSDHLQNNGYPYHYHKSRTSNAATMEVETEQINEIQTILNDRGIKYALEDPAEVLAVEIDQLSYDFDYYNYQDALTGTREDAVNEIASDIRSGNVGHLRDFLNEVMDSDDSASGTIAYDLLGRLNEYESAVKDEPVFPYHVVLQDDSVRQYFDYDESRDQFTQRSLPLNPNDTRTSIDFISPEEAMTRVDDLKAMGYKELAPEEVEKLAKEKASNLTVGDGFTLNEDTTLHLIAGDVVIPGNEALVITDVVLDSDGESDFKHFAIQSLASGEVYDLRDEDLDRIGYKFNDHYPSYDRAESAELTEDEKTLMFGTPGQANEVSDRMDSIRKGEMNMNFEEFKAYLQEHIKEYLPEKYADADVSIQSVVKNNDQKLDGLMIRLEDTNISPNIYINQFFEQFENGRDIDDILATIADIRTQHEVSNDFDVSKLTDFDSVKDHITCRLVNAEQNAEYLSDKPHTIVEDLAVTYHVALGKEESGTMSAPITNRLMEGFGVDVEQLHKIALDNMDILTPVSFKSMTETMIDMMLPQMMSNGMTEEDARDAIADMLPPTEDEAMYVLTNEDKLNGAAMLLNNKVMDDITEKVGTDYFILPSSIHEVLIVPKTPEVDLETLENMVKEVNATQVAPEERLSDHVYAYDVKEHELFRADKAEERSVAKETPIIEFPNKDEEVKVAEDEGIKVDDDLAQNIEDAIKEAGGVSEKKESEKISFQVSASLVTDFEDKHGAKLSRVKIPNLNRDDPSPWKSFVIGQNERTVADNGKIEVTLPASGEHTVYAPSVAANDAVTGKPIYVNNKESVPNADLKARFDALSGARTEPEKVTVSIAENLVGKPFHSDKSGKDLVAVKVPNEDKNDKSRMATFLIDADKVSDGENGRKTLTLTEGASISLQRTEVIDKDSKKYRNVDAGKISVDDLKKRVEPHKTNIKDMVNENSVRAKEENAQNKDKTNDRPKRDGNGLGD